MMICSNQSDVIKYIKLLPTQRYILLLVRDTANKPDPDIRSVIDAVHSGCSQCQIHHLTYVSDNDAEGKKETTDELREKVFKDAVNLPCFSEKFIHEHLEKLLVPIKKQNIEQDRAFIDHIRPILINGKVADYPLYSLFTKMCEKRLQVARLNIYGRGSQDQQLYKLNLELFDADGNFKERQKMGPNMYGSGFRILSDLLQTKESRLSNLNLLSTELKREQEIMKKKKTNQQDLPIDSWLSLEIHWRNIILGSTNLSNSEQETVVHAYRDFILEGNPFEIVDGDNFELQGDFLTKVFQLFPNKKFFVICIIGPQNSGKSTLLNFLFGTLFTASDGRCTKGKNKNF